MRATLHLSAKDLERIVRDEMHRRGWAAKAIRFDVEPPCSSPDPREWTAGGLRGVDVTIETLTDQTRGGL